MGNAEYLMTREMAPFLAFNPDCDALKNSTIPIIVGVGAESRTYYAGRAADALAARLNVPVAEFPGSHAGYTKQPEHFATTLRTVLARLRESAP
jgi:hypothetical protein